MKIKHISAFLLSIYLLCLPLVAYAGTPHTVGGILKYSDNTHPVSVTWNAYITTRMGDVLTQASPGAVYDAASGGFAIQCGTFTTNWVAGEILHVVFIDGSNRTAVIDVTLTNNPADLVSDVTLALSVQQITITTLPAGKSFIADGITYTAPHTFNWELGSTHMLNCASPQAGTAGVQYVFNSWSDAQAVEHSVTVASDSTFTVDLTTQYYLSTMVNPLDGGEIIPAVPGAWYNAGSIIDLQAVPNLEPGYVFTGWQGSVTGTVNPVELIMDAPKTVTALFAIGDQAAPYISYIYPVNNAMGIPVNSTIQLKIVDDGLGINLATCSLKLDTQNIVTNGVDQTGGLASIEYNGHTCVIYYATDGEFAENSTVSVNIQCEDLSVPGNKLNKTFAFNTGDAHLTVTKKDTLGIAGGSVYDDSTRVTVTIPENALTDDTEITIGVADSYPALPEDQTGFPLAVNFGPSGLLFADSVTIAIPYNQEILDGAGVLNPLALKVFYYPVTTGEWIQLTVASANANYIYVKVLEFCYLVLGQHQVTLPKPGLPVGPVNIVINQLTGYETSKVIAPSGKSVEYRFVWGDHTQSAWLPDTTAAHKWSQVGLYGVVAIARVKTDTTNYNVSDTLWVNVDIQINVEDNSQVPVEFHLAQNYPNPFNPETTISYSLPETDFIKLAITDITGRTVRTLVSGQQNAGLHQVVWNGQDANGNGVSSGLYFYTLEYKDNVVHKKLLLVR